MRFRTQSFPRPEKCDCGWQKEKRATKSGDASSGVFFLWGVCVFSGVSWFWLGFVLVMLRCGNFCECLRIFGGILRIKIEMQWEPFNVKLWGPKY